MQLISIYLYPNKIDAFTNVSADWQAERYRRVYNRTLKLYRGTDNKIDIQVKNSDQKNRSLNNNYLVFNVVNVDTGTLVFQKDCTAIDVSSGKYYVTVGESDILDIEPGFYSYTLNSESRTYNDDGTFISSNKSIMHVDSQYGGFGKIEILASIFGDAQESFETRVFSRNITDSLETDYYISSIIDARPEISDPQTLHTFQFFTSNYTGSATIQGSLSDGGNPHVWADLSTVQIASTDDTFFSNINGKYNYFRIKHSPNVENQGTFDRILYR